MAATLKLGNANWAAKEGSLLAYNDENDNFKPLPFDFTRASSATYVASDGLIKTSTTGQPRIDFLDNTNGTLLIEPQRTNLLTYSEDFSQSFWAKSSVTLTTGFVSPDGTTNASKLVSTGADGSMQNSYTVSSGTTYTISVYLKTVSGTLDTTIGLGSPGFPQNEGTGGRYKNITVTNEWKRYSLTSTADASAVTGVGFGGFSGFSTGEEVLIWGIQLEESAYPTSYIKTQGSTVTRVQDNSSRFSLQTEILGSNTGTWYFETYKYSVNPFVNVVLTAQSNTTKSFLIDNASNSVRLRVWDASSSNTAIISTASLPNGVVKYLIKWNATNLKVYCNGSLVNSSSFTAYPYTTLHLKEGSWSNSKLSDIKFYDTEITDTQALTLTTI